MMIMGAGFGTTKYLPGTHIVRASTRSTCLAVGGRTPAGELAIPIAGDDPNAIQ